MSTKTLFKMHIGLNVSDIEKTVVFYETLFGQKATKVMDGYAKFELENPALLISFIENKPRVRPDFGHLGFKLPSREAVEDAFDRINKAQLSTFEEKGVKCCYALQDKFWVTDPDGMRWEFYYFEKDVMENDHESHENCCTEASEGACACTSKEASLEACC